MIEKIQITLYEIFGYLLPGLIACAAALIIYWALCLPLVPLPAYKFRPSALGWIVLLGLSYVLGHLVQGIGNKLLTGAEEAALGPRGSIPSELRRAGRDKAAALMGVPSARVDAVSLFRFADEYAIQHGQMGDREIFVYREGFYKGATVALLALSLAAVLRATFAGTAVRMPSYVYYVSHAQLLTAAVAVALSARICKERFYRFGSYRVTRAFFAFMALTGAETKSP
jgi:hypothetical protein